jgi:hypothetical protein
MQAIDDGRNATVGVLATFASEEDFQVYAKHPDLQAVIKDTLAPVLAVGDTYSPHCKFSTNCNL